jgi:hypothetical protein
VEKLLKSRSPYRAKRFFMGAMAAALVVLFAGVTRSKEQEKVKFQTFSNTTGTHGTFSTLGDINPDTNPFFQPLGQRFGTTCEHCHFASDAWGIAASTAQNLFNSTNGQHPLFSAPSANDLHAALALGQGGTLEERAAAYSLMLNKADALVRRNFAPATPPADPFTIDAVIDPSLPRSLHTICVDDGGHISPGVGPDNCPAGTTAAIPGGNAATPGTYLNYTSLDNAGVPQVWAHRRPLPTTNFKFLTTAAWDGRDTRQSPNPITRQTIGACAGSVSIAADTCSGGAAEIARATIRGRQTGTSGVAPDGHTYTPAEMDDLANQLTEFMSSLFVAQETTRAAGSLTAKDAKGGVVNLANQLYYFGINDVLQGDLEVTGGAPGGVHFNGTPFGPGFNTFDAWQTENSPQRASIARGQALFSAGKLTISGVGGLNGANPAGPDSYPIFNPTCGSARVGDTGIQNCILGDAATVIPASFTGSCAVCHDGTNAGNHSTRLPINIGISDKAPAHVGRAAVSDLPLFIMHLNSDPTNIKQSTDPGRAVITGSFAHIGQFKGPILHGMASRAPFFHNGMAATLEDVVNFYSKRFSPVPGGEAFTPQEKADLVAFLGSL